MKKKNGKYIIRESELKRLIMGALISEGYNPDDYKDTYTSKYTGKVPDLHDVLSGGLNMLVDLPGKLGDGLKNRKPGEGISNWWNNSMKPALTGALSAAAAGVSGLADRASKNATGYGKLSAKQTGFIDFIFPHLKQACENNGVSKEFIPVLIAHAGKETGWNPNNSLASQANNLTGIIAPGSRGKEGFAGKTLATGGVGGRPSIWFPPGIEGDPVRWYTVFSSVDDWANYYVGDLLKKQYGAFDNGPDGFARRLYIEGRPKDGKTYSYHPDPAKRLASQKRNLTYYPNMSISIKKYLESSGKIKGNKTA